MKLGHQAMLVVMLFAALSARLALLEYFSLLDPTESRYATVALEMLHGGGLLTPKLPSPEGTIPYFGKPPLHFWLTTLSYRLFGVDEWTARLPSFLAALLLLAAVFRFATRHLGETEGLLSAVVILTSGMFFFLAGASVLDMTLSALITVSLVALYEHATSDSPRTHAATIGVLAAGLAFLSKGFYAIVSIALPFLLWCVVRGNFKPLSKLQLRPILLGLSIVIAPWLIVNEYHNPGFLKYFVWNEHIGRYLFQDYQDRYGSGHRHFYGMSWLMLFIAFAPWSIFLLVAVRKTGVKRSWEWLKADPARTFAFSWGVSSALFLTFIRQLHAMYLLPSIPGIGILTACMLASSRECQWKGRLWHRLRHSSPYMAPFLWLGIIALGCFLKFTLVGVLLAVIVCGLGYPLLKKSQSVPDGAGLVALIGATFIPSYLLVIVMIGPYTDYRRSAEPLLRRVSDSEVDGVRVDRVGVLKRNSYSHYWSSKAWKNELKRPIEVVYLDYSTLGHTDLDFLLVKAKGIKDIRPEVDAAFESVLQEGQWQLFRRKPLRAPRLGLAEAWLPSQ